MTTDPIIKAALEAGLEHYVTSNGFIYRFAAILTATKDARIAELERHGFVDLNAAVDRFLSWKLPKDFAPDGGISFDHKKLGPTGTNLFDAIQAKEMFSYALGTNTEFSSRAFADCFTMRVSLVSVLTDAGVFTPYGEPFDYKMCDIALKALVSERDALRAQLDALNARIAELEAERDQWQSCAEDPDIGAMVNRFLGWRLPDDFHPDCGISFKSEGDYTHGLWGRTKFEPTGTNLFNGSQAKMMFVYALGDRYPVEVKEEAHP